MWFEDMVGFTENAARIYEQLFYSDGKLQNNVNGRTLHCGELTTPTLAELQANAKIIQAKSINQNASVLKQRHLTLTECVADVQALHCDPANAGALFQVASQFNLLEMPSPEVTPLAGISNYQFDRTQGPACAIACGAGTLYRNYFVEVGGRLGQTTQHQLNMIDAFERQLLEQINLRSEVKLSSLWQMKNGYALPSAEQLKVINHTLAQLSEEDTTSLMNSIKIGIQSETEVTLKGQGHKVTQAYCSAMPVAYTQHSAALWQPLAKLILQAAYQATLAAAVINAQKSGNNRVYLTLLGGGAFGNTMSWIYEAISKALTAYQDHHLQVFIVSYGRSNSQVKELVDQFA